MKVKILCFLFVGFVIAGVCNAAPLNSNEQDARAFLQHVSSKIFNHFNKFINDVFATDGNDSDEKIDNRNLVWETTKQFNEILKESQKFDDSKFTDPELKYIFKILRKSVGEAVLGEEKFDNLMSSLKMLDELSSDTDIPAYRNETIKLAFFPDIQDIFAKSNDPEELKYYWKTWRKNNGAWAISNFVNMVNMSIEVAKLNGITPLELWLDDYNITEMEKVVMQIEPIYLQLHGFIRNQLHKKYGDFVINPTKPIPHHLFEQVLAQAWTPGSIIDEMYPHKDLPPYDKILEQNNYDTLKMYKMADRFYQSLGFNPIPDEYWGKNLQMNPDEDVGDCKANIFVSTPNVHMLFCQKMDFRKFLQAHNYMGQVYYAREEFHLPAYFYDSYDLEYPVGEAVILSASTPRHLNSIGLVTEFRFTEEVKMNRLLRMGIHTLLNVPVYFVHTKVMADLYAGSVDIADLNKHYWKLMDKYVGVEPPLRRDSDAYDFPYKFYTGLTSTGDRQAVKFMTEVLGYQFYEKLCEISGQYSKRSSISEPINNCDFYGSKKAGDALKKMMQLGSSKPLREVLATIFPEDPTVNAESLIKYYAPMNSWLINKNREENVVVGWTHSKKKVSAVDI